MRLCGLVSVCLLLILPHVAPPELHTVEIGTECTAAGVTWYADPCWIVYTPAGWNHCNGASCCHVITINERLRAPEYAEAHAYILAHEWQHWQQWQALGIITPLLTPWLEPDGPQDMSDPTEPARTMHQPPAWIPKAGHFLAITAPWPWWIAAILSSG